MIGPAPARGGLLICQHEIVPRESASRFLSSRRWPVVATRCAEEALEALSKGSFDAILLDLAIPGLDGPAFLREAEELEPGVDVVLVTSQTTTDAAVALMEQGAADFISKPVRMEELELRLRRLKQAREQHSELARLRTILGDGRARPFTLHLDEMIGAELPELVRRFEREVIDWAIFKAHGDVGLAAKILGIPVSALEQLRARG